MIPAVGAYFVTTTEEVYLRTDGVVFKNSEGGTQFLAAKVIEMEHGEAKTWLKEETWVSPDEVQLVITPGFLKRLAITWKLTEGGSA